MGLFDDDSEEVIDATSGFGRFGQSFVFPFNSNPIIITRRPVDPLTALARSPNQELAFRAYLRTLESAERIAAIRSAADMQQSALDHMPEGATRVRIRDAPTLFGGREHIVTYDDGPSTAEELGKLVGVAVGGATVAAAVVAIGTIVAGGIIGYAAYRGLSRDND